MSRFSRAFEGALSTANLTQEDAALVADYHASLVSRVLSGKTALTPEHVEKLLPAISNASDREHCLAEFLFDCCPEEYREKLSVSFGRVNEAPSKNMDDLSANIAALDKLATDNPVLKDLLELLTKLAKSIQPLSARVEEQPSAYITGGARGAGPSPRRVIGGLLAAAAGRKTPPTPPSKKRPVKG